MDTYRTEEEQVEAIKRWWRENGKSTVFGVAIALTLVFGWRGWNNYQADRAGDASVIYENLLQADAAASRDSSKRQTAEHLADTLKDRFAGFSYGQYAALIKAKYAVKDGDYAAAEAELNWVLQQGPELAVKVQTQLRLARVKFAQGELDEALNIVEPLQQGAAAVQALELRGDVLRQQGETSQALAAYREASAMNRRQENPLNNPLLEMKINSLATQKIATPQTAAQN
ncbi:YfgM family protein [Spongiibacter sp.]|uniref:YfgM family protein n=1 Tax=Spongiibacter sp. TaxID=2024860 RepID=UPI00356AC760